MVRLLIAIQPRDALKALSSCSAGLAEQRAGRADALGVLEVVADAVVAGCGVAVQAAGVEADLALSVLYEHLFGAF